MLFLGLSFILFKFEDHVLAFGTDAEFAAPDAESGGDIILRFATLVRAVGFFV